MAKMRSTLLEITEEDAYPYLMRNTINNDVVLMTSKNRGTIVYLSVNSTDMLGHYSEMWNINVFEKFKGKIALEN